MLIVSLGNTVHEKSWNNKKISPFCRLLSLKAGGCVTNSVDPDQMPHSVASDLALHCLFRSGGAGLKAP